MHTNWPPCTLHSLGTEPLAWFLFADSDAEPGNVNLSFGFVQLGEASSRNSHRAWSTAWTSVRLRQHFRCPSCLCAASRLSSAGRMRAGFCTPACYPALLSPLQSPASVFCILPLVFFCIPGRLPSPGLPTTAQRACAPPVSLPWVLTLGSLPGDRDTPPSSSTHGLAPGHTHQLLFMPLPIISPVF